MMCENEKFIDIFSEEERISINQEFSRVENLCYLDHTGSALYTESYIKSVAQDLCNNVYSNPHSNGLTSRFCSDSVDQIRYRILQHYNTHADEYSVIFTSGATGALKLVADSFLWTNCEEASDEWFPKDDYDKREHFGEFVYMEDNHTSVLGMRDVVTRRGASVRCLSHEETFHALNKSDFSLNKKEEHKTNSLFVYSAQCNFSGVKYPLAWIRKVQDGVLESPENSDCPSRWYCLLDAATYLASNPLDLSVVKPDFVCVSFYKIFGYPTGLGALIVRNQSSDVLQKDYYGGGTVLIALSSQSSYIPRPVLHERFEDGTINFLSVVALQHGFSSFSKLVGNMEKVSLYTFNLAKYAFNALLRLHHSNGNPAVRLYVDTPYDDVTTQGNIVNFNIVRSNGDYVGYAEVLHLANMKGIQLRTGCFCNPGACRRHLSLSVDEVKSHYKAGHVCGDENDLIDGKPTGSVRVSFGYSNTKSDADKLVCMIEECFVQGPVTRKYPNEWKLSASLLKEKFLPEYIKKDNFFALKYIYLLYEDILFNQSCKYSDQESTPHIRPTDKSEPLVTKNENVEGPFLSSIFIYPVKSCGKFSVNTWDLDIGGLRYDRAWMIINHVGVALTQKREPKLCLIRPIVDLVHKKLHLTFPGLNSYSVDLEISTSSVGKEIFLCQSKVCSDRVQGLDCGDGVAEWLSEALGKPGLRLIKQIPTESVPAKRSTGSLSLANQGQYLLINSSSIQWLSEQIENDSDCSKMSLLDRFRCNFVVSGVDLPLVEQTWSHVSIKQVQFMVDGPCRRCQMICIDQDTGKLSKEPLTTLSQSFHGKLVFGIYLSAVSNDKVTISTGDKINFF